jgi:hypothetical protein
MKDENIGYMWNVSLNSRAIMDSGIRLNSDEWILFYAIEAMFGKRWASPITEDGITYVFVSNKLIKRQLRPFPDLCEISDVTLWRKIKNLENAGLVVRRKDNDKKGKCYLGPGPESDQFGNVPISNLQDPPFRNESPPLSEMKGYNNTSDNSTSNTSSNEEVSAPQISKKKFLETTSKHKAVGFYESELGALDKKSDAEKVVAAGTVEKFDVRRAHYKRLAELMINGDPLTCPNGMGTTLLKMKDQLYFSQYCKLIDEVPCTPTDIKEVVAEMNNKYDKHLKGASVLYLNIKKWVTTHVSGQQRQQNFGNTPPVSKPVSTKGYTA